MRRMIGSVAVSVLLGGFTGAAAQLPPAQAEASAATEPGPPPRISPGQTCAGQPEGAACWQKLANHPECYFWTGFFDQDRPVAWTGECSGRLAQGAGMLQWEEDPPSESGVPGLSKNHSGSFKDGQKHGRWVEGFFDGIIHGSRMEGSYVNGQKHGQWVEDMAGGQFVRKGFYVDGQKHGHWVELHGPSGDAWEGSYVDGQKHGRWIQRDQDGNVETGGSYVEGKQHGHWVERNMGGRVQEGPYVAGNKHGHWVRRNRDGSVEEGPYVEGCRHGRWVKRYRDGNVEEGSYVEGLPGQDWTISRDPERSEYSDGKLIHDNDRVERLRPEMVVIPAGRFRMGCVSGIGCANDEMPVHEVTIASFALSKYEVTIDEYNRFTDATGRARPRGILDGEPVTGITWYDAVAYTEWLSARTGERYRLPTEAEWEYAARAGTSGPRYAANLDAIAWYGEDYSGGTHPVGQKAPNAFGLHDMLGNVEEWVQDCWNDDYEKAPTDGSAWEGENCNPIYRVVRGGSWSSDPESVRSAGRGWVNIGQSLPRGGFRVARTLPP